MAAREANGFFGPDSWYMNHRDNREYAATVRNGGTLLMPVLFLHGEYDYRCQTVTSGHWMAQEKPVAVNAALAKWLAAQLPQRG